MYFANMKIYTKTGDIGTTSLFSGDRVEKNNARINLYGTVDELIAIISLAIEFEPPQKIKSDLETVNKKLFVLCADFATPLTATKNATIKRISDEDIFELEKLIDEYFSFLPELKSFIFLNGNKCSAFINQARTVCRRAERIAVELAKSETLTEASVRYLNRLSDYLFAAMRYTNYLTNSNEVKIEF